MGAGTPRLASTRSPVSRDSLSSAWRVVPSREHLGDWDWYSHLYEFLFDSAPILIWTDEASRVNVALEELGGELGGIHHYEIPELGGSRALIVIKKVKPTSKHYPRRTGVASKRPPIAGRSSRPATSS